MTHPWRRPASREEIEAQRREARERREAQTDRDARMRKSRDGINRFRRMG